MADRITKEQRSRIMSRIKSVNTSLEINFRKLLFKNKVKGFRKHPKMLGNPDFASRKKGASKIYMHAQYHLLDYYQKLGFKERGHKFKEAGVDHISMYLN